jgi:Flp pilus assembly protein CpaB
VKRSNRLVILVGVLLAVLAFVGIVILLNQGRGPAEGPAAQTVTVLVATQPIEIGDPVTADVAAPKEVPADAVEQTRLADVSQLRGTRAAVPMVVDEQITAEKAGMLAGPVSIEAQLEAGERAIAFQVDRVTGLDFLIVPGDHIDVVIAQEVTPIQQTADSVAEQEDNPDAPARYEAVTGLTNVRTVKTILQDRRVLYVSQTRARAAVVGTPTASPAAGEQPQQQQVIDSVIIVFAGNDQDAELVKFAQRDLGEVGQLTAIVRRIEDTEEGVEDPETTGITLNLLIEEYGVPIPDIIVLATQRPAGRNR